MVEYVYNSTSSVIAQSSSTSSTLAVNKAAVAADPLLGVIVILSIAVIAGIFFIICRLFLKAEAHVHDGRETNRAGLLVEPSSLYWDA